MTFTPTDATDYNTATKSTTITVDPATPMLTVSAPGGGFDGSPIPATVTIAGVGRYRQHAVREPGGHHPDRDLLRRHRAPRGPDLGSTPPTAPGTYTVVASFPGTADYDAAQSAPVTFTIGQGHPDGRLDLVGRLGRLGQSVTFVATVAAGAVAGDRDGHVLRRLHADRHRPARRLGPGDADDLAPRPGTYAITASYGGDADDLARQRRRPSPVSVGQASHPGRPGPATGLQEEEGGVAGPGGGGPADGPRRRRAHRHGDLRDPVKSKKKVTEKVLGTASLSGGTATLTVKPNSVLKKPITIVYGGDADFLSSYAEPADADAGEPQEPGAADGGAFRPGAAATHVR